MLISSASHEQVEADLERIHTVQAETTDSGSEFHSSTTDEENNSLN